MLRYCCPLLALLLLLLLYIFSSGDALVPRFLLVPSSILLSVLRNLFLRVSLF